MFPPARSAGISRTLRAYLPVIMLIFLATATPTPPVNAVSYDHYPTAKTYAANLTAVATITLDKIPESMAINEETNRVYVSAERALTVIDGATDEIEREIPLEFTASALAVNPKTNRIFVSGDASVGFGDTLVIDGYSHEVVGKIPCRAYYSYEIAVNPATNTVYIADIATIMGYPDSIEVYDGKTFEHKASIEIPTSIEYETIEKVGIAVNPETNRLYATWTGKQALYLIDGGTNEIIQTTPLNDSFSTKLIVNPSTNRVYTCHQILAESYSNMALDGQSLNEVTKCQIEPQAVNPTQNLLYATKYTTEYKTVYVLNGTTHETLGSLEVENGINDLAANPNTGKIYLTHKAYKQISVIQLQLYKTTAPSSSAFPQTWILLAAILVVVTVLIAILVARHRRKPKSATRPPPLP